MSTGPQTNKQKERNKWIRFGFPSQGHWSKEGDLDDWKGESLGQRTVSIKALKRRQCPAGWRQDWRISQAVVSGSWSREDLEANWENLTYQSEISRH